jgi:hypothetical protein
MEISASIDKAPSTTSSHLKRLSSAKILKRCTGFEAIVRKHRLVSDGRKWYDLEDMDSIVRIFKNLDDG